MSLPAVIFDDIELWACSYMRDALEARWEPFADGVFVSNAIPVNAETGEPERRPRMVIFRRDGGARTNQVLDNPRLAVDVWAMKDADAVNLARLVNALLHAAPGDENVKAVRETSGPNRVPDPSRQPRVFSTFELTTKGDLLT